MQGVRLVSMPAPKSTGRAARGLEESCAVKSMRERWRSVLVPVSRLLRRSPVRGAGMRNEESGHRNDARAWLYLSLTHFAPARPSPARPSWPERARFTDSGAGARFHRFRDRPDRELPAFDIPW